MRLAARWTTFKKFYSDDAFVIFAWFFALATAIDWQLVSSKMYQFVSVTSGHLWPPPPNFITVTGSYYDGSLAVLVFYYSSLWSIKIAFLLFFRRLGQNVMGQKVLWCFIFGFTVATYLICIGDIQYSCLVSPLPELLATCSSDANIQFQTATLKLNCALDVITDFTSSLAPFNQGGSRTDMPAVMAIPISMLWSVQMSIRKKLALIVIFSFVIVTMAIAVVRVAVISALSRQPDTSWSCMWSSVEQCIGKSVVEFARTPLVAKIYTDLCALAIIVSCLGSFRALFPRQDSRKPTPQPSLIHASGNLFLRGNKRVKPSDLSISLTNLTGQPSQ